MRWLPVVMALAGCRWGFDVVGNSDAVVIDPDAGFVLDDAGQLVSCQVDTDCGRCQRCDNQHCQRATFVSVGLGQKNGCALDERGDVWCWGTNDYLIVDFDFPATTVVARPRRRPDVTADIDQIAMGWGVMYLRTTGGALESRGTINGDAADSTMAWGKLFASNFDACALTSAGAVHCSGENGNAQLGRGSTSGEIGLGQFAPGKTDWRYIAPGNTTCGLDTSNRLFCVGSNDFGELGRGTTSTYEVDVAQVGVGADWDSLNVAERHVCAIRQGGTLWCWGADMLTANNITTPTQVGTSTDWSHLDSYDRCSCAVNAGTLWCKCGDSSVAVPLVGSRSTPWAAMPVSIDLGTTPVMGGESACVKQQGNWVCWGNNTVGAVGVDTLAVVPPTPLCE